MVSTGLSEVIGSWKIIAMFLPRTSRIASSSSASRSRPASLTEPPAIRPGGSGTSRISDNAVMLLPQPDSPTIASVSCAPSVKLTPSTALTTPWRKSKYVRKPSTSSKGGSFEISLATGRPVSRSLVVTVMARPSVAQPRIEDVAQRVAEQVSAEHRQADGGAREDHQPGRGAYVFGRRIRQHAAPGRMRLRYPEAEERQRCLSQDRSAELRGSDNDQWRQRIGQHVAPRDTELAHAHGARCLDEGLLAQAQRVGAYDAGGIGNKRDRDGDDGIVERRSHHQCQHQERHGLQYVDDALDDQIDPATDIARGQAQYHAEKRAERGRAQADRERDTRAIDDEAQIVDAHQ